MNYFLKIFFISLILFISSIADDVVTPKKIYLNFEDYPSRVFTNQKFDITLKAVILEDFDSIQTSFVDSENINILTKEPKWIKEKDNIYFTTLTFKAINSSFKLPLVTIALIKNQEILEYKSIETPKITFEQIAINQEIFSNIIAKTLQVNSIKTKQYSNNQLLCTINIEATNSNLEDFYFSKYKEQGIKTIDENYPNQSIYYYVIVPSHTKNIDFSYYNTLLKEFVKLSLNVNLEEDLVSTQTDLNPYNSNMLLYKQVGAISLLVVFLLVYLFSKRVIYLVVITLLVLVIAYLFIPNKKIIVDKDIKVYILPSKLSTVYKTTKHKELAQIINEKEDFIKILFEDNKIGWIKKDDYKKD